MAATRIKIFLRKKYGVAIRSEISKAYSADDALFSSIKN